MRERPNWQVLSHAMGELPVSPCEKGCNYADRCAKELLCCKAFDIYVTYARSSHRLFDDLPTSERFAQHMVDDEPLVDNPKSARRISQTTLPIDKQMNWPAA